jgi:dihydroorotase-like cyclic amidohydrolase
LPERRRREEAPTASGKRKGRRRLGRVPAKGRIKVGADADIIVFDADAIIDRATFEKPVQT